MNIETRLELVLSHLQNPLGELQQEGVEIVACHSLSLTAFLAMLFLSPHNYIVFTKLPFATSDMLIY